MAVSAPRFLMLMFVSTAMGEEFLGVVPIERRRAALLQELETSLAGGRRHVPTEERIIRFEDALRPTFAALPKVHGGFVGAISARYALHRLFLNLHGWRIKGLDTAGEAWDDLSLDNNVGRMMPERLRELFDARLNVGMDLHELAALGVALEHLVHSDSEARLAAVFQALKIPTANASMRAGEADDVISSFMMTFANAVPLENITLEVLRQTTVRAPLLAFLLEVRKAVLPGKTVNVSFEDVEAVVEEVGERYGRWQNIECAAMKSDLLALEDHKGSGRVKLADFYTVTLNSGSYFDETRDFLRGNGALDEADPVNPRVIIPNYVMAPSNCLAAMAYYSVCCFDDCDRMLGEFERKVGAPSASPATLLKLLPTVASLSPGSVAFPAPLVERLYDVANFHGGIVPLHGRLFAQWMHHAFPGDCPYPHLAGTTKPMHIKEYTEQTGQSHAMTQEEMQLYVQAANESQAIAEPAVLPWVAREELVDRVAHRSGRLQSVVHAVSQLLLLFSAGSTIFAIGRQVLPRRGALKTPAGVKVHVV